METAEGTTFIAIYKKEPSAGSFQYITIKVVPSAVHRTPNSLSGKTNSSLPQRAIMLFLRYLPAFTSSILEPLLNVHTASYMDLLRPYFAIASGFLFD